MTGVECCDGLYDGEREEKRSALQRRRSSPPTVEIPAAREEGTSLEGGTHPGDAGTLIPLLLLDFCSFTL